MMTHARKYCSLKTMYTGGRDSLYRPANRPISNIGELENVLGMTPELMAKLSEFIVALPVYMANFAPYKQAFSPSKQGAQGFDGPNSPALTKLNINTAPPNCLLDCSPYITIKVHWQWFYKIRGNFKILPPGRTKVH